MSISIKKLCLAIAMSGAVAFSLTGCSSSKDAIVMLTAKAEKGDVDSMVKLADLYCRGGYHLDPDDQVCGMWMKRAAEKGHREAQYNLGMMFEKGVGMKENPVEAYRWYNVSFANGYLRSGDNAQRIWEHLSPTQRADAKKLVDTGLGLNK